MKRVVFALAALALVGCSSSTPELPICGDACNPPPPPSCLEQFAGNTQAVEKVAGSCVTFTKTETGTWLLGMVLASPGKLTESVQIDLGAEPAAGTITSATTLVWAVTGSSTSGCVFAAGNTSVPTGSFSLTLTSLSLGGDFEHENADAGDAGVRDVAHGNLEATQTVQAPIMTMCGPGDEELVRVDF